MRISLFGPEVIGSHAEQGIDGRSRNESSTANPHRRDLTRPAALVGHFSNQRPGPIGQETLQLRPNLLWVRLIWLRRPLTSRLSRGLVPITTEPDPTEPDSTEPDTTEPVAVDTDGDAAENTVAVIAVIGFGALIALASWWMVRRRDVDDVPHPPAPDEPLPGQDLL